MRKCILAFVILAMLTSVSTARAGGHHGHWLASDGYMEAELLHAEGGRLHLWSFMTVDAKYVHHVSDSLAIIPAIGFGWTPHGNQRGFSSSFMFEYRLHSRVRFDFSTGALYDRAVV